MSTLSWVIAGFAAVMLGLITTCTLRAALHSNAEKAARARQVLRLLLVFAAGAVTAIKLHKAGLP
jgi:hypothetical protein